MAGAQRVMLGQTNSRRHTAYDENYGNKIARYTHHNFAQDKPQSNQRFPNYFF
jgi:hypothetical protein